MIDWHTHAFPPRIAARLAADIGRAVGREPAGDGSVTDLCRHLDLAGLEKAVCFTAALKPDQVRPANNWLLSIPDQSERLIPFGTIHPEHPDWAGELDRLERHGILGLKLHPDLSDLPLHNPVWLPLFEAVQGRFAVMIHMGPPRKGHSSLSRPADLARILDLCSQLTVIAAHLGGLHQWQETVEHLVGRDVYLDTSCCHRTISENELRSILNRHPRERILFGSDYPLFSPRDELRLFVPLLQRCGWSCDGLLQNGSLLLKKLENRRLS